jgi:hypothetical protein
VQCHLATPLAGLTSTPIDADLGVCVTTAAQTAFVPRRSRRTRKSSMPLAASFVIARPLGASGGGVAVPLKGVASFDDFSSALRLGLGLPGPLRVCVLATSPSLGGGGIASVAEVELQDAQDLDVLR